MANYFNLVLDTTAPSNPTISLDGGAQYAQQQLVTATFSTGDGSTTGYQIKIWGNVDTTYDTSVQATEAESQWITYTTSKQLKLASGDGSKSVSFKIRDDVHNQSSIASDSIILDTTKPVVTTTSPDVSKISKVSGKDVASFSFTVDTTFVEYKVKVVSSSGASHDTGTLIAETNGSVNMSGTGSFPSATPINCQIDGSDLEVASAGDGNKIVKVFVQDEAGNWSA